MTQSFEELLPRLLCRQIISAQALYVKTGFCCIDCYWISCFLLEGCCREAHDGIDSSMLGIRGSFLAQQISARIFESAPSFLCSTGIRFLMVRCVQVRSSIQEEFSPTKEKNKDFNLPKQPKESDGEKKTTKDSTHSSRATWPRSYEEAKSKFEDQGPGDFLLYGGAATLGVLLSGALLNSLESYPVVPETMQLIGVACSLFVATRVIQGQPASFKVSPVKAVIELMENGRLIQQTSLVLPEDLDEETVATMQRLARERDSAVNQVEEMKRQTSEYSQVLKEKEALETVALQLAEERETAMSEVTALKFTVESMSERMKGIEAMLDREIGLLKSQNQALETVTLQLAQERDMAIKETATLKASSAAEKQALEEVAGQLAKERDDALSELKDLMDVVAKMRTPTSG